MNVLDTARSYVAGGCCVIPIALDGTKRPALPKWKEYQERFPTDSELRAWFGGDAPSGIAILGGDVSFGVEVLDFDQRDAWEEWRVLTLQALRQVGHTLPRLPLVQTPTDGRHLYLRLEDTPRGNTKLAVRRVNGAVETVIETRGAGGYVVAPGSPLAVHPLRRPYRLLQGDLCEIPTITADNRAILLEMARSLSETTQPERVVAHSPRLANGERPGDIYNRTAEWDSLLRRHGWRKTGQHGETGLWLRPSDWSGPGHSATTNHAGTGLLHVFSTNAAPFESECSYSLFAAFAMLEHGGDFMAAAHALKVAGYTRSTQGSPRGLSYQIANPQGRTRQLCRY
jgi:putative DNA primase/helicase